MTEQVNNNEPKEAQPKKGKHFYRKDKPWDKPIEGEDRWKSVEMNEGDMKSSLLEESSFSTQFPKYREKYIKEVFGAVKKALNEKGVKTELDQIEGSMTVKTTKKTWDPYAIIKARDVIKLLARSAPYQAALRVLDDDIYCDIIKIRGICTSKEKFVKRRNRLIGPKGNTIKALEMLTDCFLLVQGSTVSVVGHFKQMKQVRRIVTDTMKNIHPIYHIKELMIKKELAKDDKLKDENWERFLPNYKKKIGTLKEKKKIKKIKKNKGDNPNPPEQQKRKEDYLIETGEYFLTKDEKAKPKKEKKDGSKKKIEEKQNEQIKKYQAPDVNDELKKDKARKDKLQGLGKRDAGLSESVGELKKKFKIDSSSFKL